MTGRIYIRDFSYEATAEDLSILISKVCPVEEVYISGPTPTGINRSFAIVTVNASNNLVEKCIKTFNNCHWKGTRIYVEKAKEYYKDRFERERAREVRNSTRLLLASDVEEDTQIDILETELLLEIDSQDTEEKNEIRTDDSDLLILPTSDARTEIKILVRTAKVAVIKIKKSRDGPPLSISMVPSLSSSASVKKSKTFIPCGRRTTFDYDDSGSIIYTPLDVDGDGTSGDEDSDESEDDDVISRIKASEDEKLKEEKEKSKLMSNKDKDVLKHNKDAKAFSTGSSSSAASDVAKPAGGGARKGFGGLSTVSVAALPVPLSQAYLKKLISAVPTINVDCCIETDRENQHIGNSRKIFGLDQDDLRNDSAKESIEFAGDDDNRNPYRVDDVACVDAIELTDEALERERNRSMLMFASIMESAKLNPYENINNNTLPNKLNKSNGKNTEDDKDKNIEKIKSDKIKNNLNVVKSWEAIKIQRFDPTNLKSSQKFELSSVEAKERNEAAAIAVKKLLAAEKAVEKAGKVAEVRKAEVTATEEISAGGFANLDELKNIFYKEGGVWWGDDGTLNEAVSKGNIGEDALFREAERLGIDIRKGRDEEPNKADVQSSSSNSHSGLESGSSSSFLKGGSNTTKMTFGFFDDFDEDKKSNKNKIEDENNSDLLPSSSDHPTINKTKINKNIFYNEKETENDISIENKRIIENKVDPRLLLPPRTEEHSLENNGQYNIMDNEEEVDIIIPMKIMNLQDIINNAKKFCREKKEAELFSDWRETRDKLVTDYKRKHKDAKKRILDLGSSKTVYAAKDLGPSKIQGNLEGVDKESVSGKRGRNEKGSGYGVRGGKKSRGGSKSAAKKILIK